MTRAVEATAIVIIGTFIIMALHKVLMLLKHAKREEMVAQNVCLTVLQSNSTTTKFMGSAKNFVVMEKLQIKKNDLQTTVGAVYFQKSLIFVCFHFRASSGTMRCSHSARSCMATSSS